LQEVAVAFPVREIKGRVSRFVFPLPLFEGAEPAWPTFIHVTRELDLHEIGRLQTQAGCKGALVFICMRRVASTATRLLTGRQA
jgi:hypothetical protein